MTLLERAAQRMSHYDKLTRMAEEWDKGCLEAAEMAMDPEHSEDSAFYIERAYQFAIVASALHRMKGNA